MDLYLTKLAQHIANILLGRGVNVSIDRIEIMLGRVGFENIMRLLHLTNYDLLGLERLLNSVGDPAQLERLLVKVGNASRLEKLLSLANNDAAKLAIKSG